MTILELLKKPNLAPLESELLLAYVLKKERLFIISHPEYKVPPEKARAFLKLVAKRKAHWPIAYLLQEKGFYDLSLQVNKNVLIPRPETEIMVDYLNKELISLHKLLTKKSKESKGDKESKKLKPANSPKIELTDLGTGSGAIIIALAKKLRASTRAVFKNINFWGLDIKSAALKVARLNAKKYKLEKKIKFLNSDLLNNFPQSHLTETNLVIAANLPYLTPLEIKQEKSLRHEPKSALAAGSDGLKYYNRLLKNLSSLPFASLILMMEINPKQSKRLLCLVKKYLLNSTNQTINDLSGQKRFVLVKALPNTKKTKYNSKILSNTKKL